MAEGVSKKSSNAGLSDSKTQFDLALDLHHVKIFRKMNVKVVLEHLSDFRGLLTKAGAERIKNCLKSPSEEDFQLGCRMLRKKLDTPDAATYICNALRAAGDEDLAELLNTTAFGQSRSRNPSGKKSAAAPLPKLDTSIPDIVVDRVAEPNDTHAGQSVFLKGMLKQLTVYRNFSHPKGLVLLINNKNFNEIKDKESLVQDMDHCRHGTDIDAGNLENLFKNRLGYRVSRFDDLPGERMEQELDSFSDDAQLNFVDSAFVVVLTHGWRHCLFGVDWEPVSIETMVGYFQADRCKALSRKPKIFVIQSCRGRYPVTPEVQLAETMDDSELFKLALMQSRQSSRGSSGKRSPHFDETDLYKSYPGTVRSIPNSADLLIAYSSSIGFKSFRNPERGSFYVRTLCQVFDEEAEKEHILTMLTKVPKTIKLRKLYEIL